MYKSTILITTSLILLASCSNDTENQEIWFDISESQYENAWPFPEYSTAKLSCQVETFGGVDRPLVLVQLGSTTYGLNGAAMGVGNYPDARTQMAKHPEYGTYELGATSTLIEQAQNNCS